MIFKRSKNTFRVISWGGIGDALLTTPSFKAIKERYPKSRLIVYYSNPIHKDVFKNNPFIDSLRAVSFVSAPISYFLYFFKLAKFTQPAYGVLAPGKFYKKKATEIIAEMLELGSVDNEIQVYLTNEEDQKGREILSEYKNPITIHITSNCSKNQNWPTTNWDALIRSMPEYTFIQLGGSNEEKIESAIDLRGKTTLRESFSIIKHSKSFVGVVSSLAHATNAFNLRGVILFGPSTPIIWGHTNNINLYKNYSCAPCIDVLLGVECPYGKPCMDKISVEEVKEAILKQIEVLSR